MSMTTDSVAGNLYGAYNNTNPQQTQETKKEQKAKGSDAVPKKGDYGKQIGNVKLSETGAKYYEQLKKQFGNMDFIVVSRDQKENAQAHAGAYANPHKTVVLIDEDKIEKMATDENYRKQYEGVIRNAALGIADLKSQLEASGQSHNVVGYGMQVDDGGIASYFAVLEKSSADQKERIEKRAEEKKEAKREEERLEKKKDQEKRVKEKRTREIKSSQVKKYNDHNTVTVSANSIEELMQKISDTNFGLRSDVVRTSAEMQVGQHVNYAG